MLRYCINYLIILLITVILGCGQTEVRQSNLGAPEPTQNAGSQEKIASIPNAVSMRFTDIHPEVGLIAGKIIITPAQNEPRITHYELYWGNSKKSILPDGFVASIQAVKGNLEYQLVDNTTLPKGAQYFLLASKGANAESNGFISEPIKDRGLPTQGADNLNFIDLDLDGGEIQGELLVTPATDESTLTHYQVYWGKTAFKKASESPVASLVKTGDAIIFPISENTPLPQDTRYFIVLSSNEDGERPFGISIPIIDKGLPGMGDRTITFNDTDLDGGEIGGAIDLGDPSLYPDITNYNFYWGSSATERKSDDPFGTLSTATETNIFDISENTFLDETITHILIYCQNLTGESVLPLAIPIVDLGIPTATVTSVDFYDEDHDGFELSGNLTIVPPSQQHDIESYRLYWGSSTAKLFDTPIEELEKQPDTFTYEVPADTIRPAEATHILVYTANEDGEMRQGAAVLIEDSQTPADPVPDALNWSDVGEFASTENLEITGLSPYYRMNVRVELTVFYGYLPLTIMVNGVSEESIIGTGSHQFYLKNGDELQFIHNGFMATGQVQVINESNGDSVIDTFDLLDGF